MKTRFTTLDIMSIVPQLNHKLSGMRVNQVYDIDSKTYLFKFTKTANETKTEESVKEMLLIESGIRIHSTEYEWPKNNNPNGFTMKLRKHLKNKRLESITQLGVDRIVDLKFGSNEASYHVIVELYDRGNLVITDYQLIILNILRPRKLGSDEDVNLVVREKYPIDSAKSLNDFRLLTINEIKEIIDSAKDGENLKKILNPHVIYGAALIEHSFIELGLSHKLKLNKQQIDMNEIESALKISHNIMQNITNTTNGYIIQKVEKRIGEPNSEVISYQEFHPLLLNQYKNTKDMKIGFIEMPSFDKSVDIFFSSIEGQKIDAKALQQEKEAMKKLDNIKRDHEKRLEELNKLQEADIRKAKLIESNSELVEKALLVLRSAIANQYSWKHIQELIDDAKAREDPIATRITSLKLSKNNFTIKLSDPYDDSNVFTLVDIDIDLSAHSNARKYYDMRRTAAKKEQKTIESSTKAFKSAERKAMQTLKEVAVKTSITKARKVLWFEKFLWFISSDNYIVIAGRDAQQNEMIVKRYMKSNDLYVHADLHGATSVVIKNSNPLSPIPPKTLSEAGDMAICYSAAWEAKTITSAFWVYPNQVSKTAPTGEYLTVGSFMIRGKKNYLPLSHLVMGFGFVFKLDEESTERHKNERKRHISLESESLSTFAENESIDEEEIKCESDSQTDDEVMHFPDTKPKLEIKDKEEEEEKLGFSDESPVIVKSKEPRKKQIQKSKQKSQNINPNNNEIQKVQQNNGVGLSDKPQQLKRGQKSKLKKIKEKYKDQDEEERQLKMSILGHYSSQKNSSLEENSVNETKNNKSVKEKLSNNKNNTENKTKDLAEKLNKQSLKVSEIDQQINDETNERQEEENEDEEVPVGQSDDVKVIESLTGMPLTDDNLLFAIPVCAPYSSMHNYKYKVKVLPGFNRRGKAAKTALQLFLREKTATEREKDVLKAVKDQDISKNIPMKIKITASNLNSVKNKK